MVKAFISAIPMQAAAVVVVKALQCKIISYKILKPFDLSEGFCF
jgi:hypothetical protein